MKTRRFTWPDEKGDLHASSAIGPRRLRISFEALVMSLMIAATCFLSAGWAAEQSPRSVAKRDSAWAAHLSASETADRVAEHILERGILTTELGNALQLEALLALYDSTGDQRYLTYVSQNVHSLVESQRMDAVSSIGFELFERTRDAKDMGLFEKQAREDRANTVRAFDGAVSFFRDEFAVIKQKDGGDIHLTREMAPIFIDQLAEYAPRMAKVGWMTGDAEFYKEAAGQILIFRSALRDPATGLWSHGRGWYGSSHDVTAVKWGRAHAWLIRALVETMTYLPPDSPEFRELSGILDETANSLVRYQDSEGFWHQVVDRPESYQETSSTGLISYYLARAISQGYLPRRGFEEASKQAFEALAKHRISSSGVVYGASMSTAPQRSLEIYLARPTPVGDPHGVGAAIFAAAGQLLLEREMLARYRLEVPQQGRR